MWGFFIFINMNLTEFNILISTSQKWTLYVSTKKKKWKLICDRWSIFTNEVAVDIHMKGIKEVDKDRWYLIGNGYLNLKKDYITLNDFYTNSNLENITIPDLQIFYGNNLVFPKQTFL